MDMDQTHTPMFHQIEGLAIDRDITMANMKWVLEEFFSAYFGTRVRTRFRASHFPFTEPSAEVDIQCSWVDGQLRVARGMAGSRCWARAWSIRMCCARAGSIPSTGRASPSAWGSTVSRC
jgi:hypothetical protein